MNIRILDCTLRDGGYVNQWNFGKKVIKSVVKKLECANVDIIECGFLTTLKTDENYSLFSEVTEIKEILFPKRKQTMYVAMIAIGKDAIHPSKLPEYDNESIDGIRLTFHQYEIEQAIEWANIIIEKGYKIFMQPVGTVLYSDYELLKLIEQMNELQPYAFYIVDTLGGMHRDELLHTFYLIDNNLKYGIHVGFHPHNNLQLAFSNAQELSKIQTKRTILIDSSIYGMGRGAGNLPTELITQYINVNIGMKYTVTEILAAYDEYISFLHNEYKWGYTMAYYIAANYICHPDYASFLLNKQTLTMEDIEKIIIAIPQKHRALYNKVLIEELYVNYQNKAIKDNDAIAQIVELLEEKEILILAPGKSLLTQQDNIQTYISQHKPYVISVNFIDESMNINACFISNHKRRKNLEIELENLENIIAIATSNIEVNTRVERIYVDYFSYINCDEMVFDNAGLMLLKLLMKCNAKKITLAGFDGFKNRYNDNYYSKDLILQVNDSELVERQHRIKWEIDRIKKLVEVNFLTSSVYEE